MATTEFDHDRWPGELRGLAAACDEAMAAYLEDMDDKRLLGAFEAASRRFHEAHRRWLGEHPDRIPGLIAHRLRQHRGRHRYGFRDYESAERVREMECSEIEGLWDLHRQVLDELAGQDDAEPASPAGPTEPPRFTVEVATIGGSQTTTYFGVFATIEEATVLAAQWHQSARAEGLTRLFIDVAEIHDVSAYTRWIAPERRRVEEERAARSLAAERTRLLLDFHEDAAIRELGPQLIADALTQTGRFEVTSPDEAVDSYRRAALAAGRLLTKPVDIAAVRSPEGTVLKVVIRTTIDLGQYRVIHGQAPRGPGSWVLRNTETGEQLTLSGKWGEVRASLARGNWILLP